MTIRLSKTTLKGLEALDKNDFFTIVAQWEWEDDNMTT